MTLQQQRTQEALRALPSAGWIGRRDRALHVLSQMAGMTDEDIATLTAGDVVIADGAATITAATGTGTLAASSDTLICGPCALARWLHLLDMTVNYPDRYVIDAVVARAPAAVRQLTAPVSRRLRVHRRDPADAAAATDRPLGTDLPDHRPTRASRPSPTARPPPRRHGPRPPTTRHPRAVGPLKATSPGNRAVTRPARPQPRPTAEHAAAVRVRRGYGATGGPAPH